MGIYSRILVAIFVLTAATIAFSNTNLDMLKGNAKLGSTQLSSHTPVSHAGNHEGWDWFNGYVKEAYCKRFVVGGKSVYVARKRLKGKFKTPIAGSFKGRTNAVTMSGKVYYESLFAVKKPWPTAGKIDDSVGKLRLKYKGDSEVKFTSKAAHIELKEEPEKIKPEDLTNPTAWTDITPLVYEFTEGGWAAIDETDPENPVYEVDEDGIILWEVAPALVLRLTSTATDLGAGQVEYEYVLENLSGEDREFDFPQITGPSNENGWSGTVYASTTETLVFNVTDESVCVQTCQADTLIPDVDEEDGEEYTLGIPARVYVPGGRLIYSGENEIISVQYDNVLDANRISFEVTEFAQSVVLIRRSASGIDIVFEEDAGYAVGQTHEIVDYEFEGGLNEYWVRTGVDPNGYTGDPESITN